MPAEFDVETFAYELTLISDWLTMTAETLGATEAIEADIIAHATEDSFTTEALELVARLSLRNQPQRKFLDLLEMMIADHIPMDEQTAEERARHKLPSADLPTFMARLRENKAAPVEKEPLPPLESTPPELQDWLMPTEDEERHRQIISGEANE